MLGRFEYLLSLCIASMNSVSLLNFTQSRLPASILIHMWTFPDDSRVSVETGVGEAAPTLACLDSLLECAMCVCVCVRACTCFVCACAYTCVCMRVFVYVREYLHVYQAEVAVIGFLPVLCLEVIVPHSQDVSVGHSTFHLEPTIPHLP